jgi:TPR repeat protein
MPCPPRRTGAAVRIASRAAALAFGLLTAVPAAADFADGLAAYDAGDYRAALEAWRPLAEADNAEAQVALADLYASGALGAARPGQAAEWYRRAAEQGHAMAQLNLGDMYARGAGVPRDPVRAYVWLSLAARQGRAWAERRRREIVVRLTPAEATKATALLIEIRNRLYLLESEGGSR